MIKNILKNYKHLICICIILISLLFSIFYFKYAHLRLFETFVDLFNSIKFYINELFNINLKGNLTLNELSSQPFKLPFNLPNSWNKFKVLWNNYWKLFINIENFEKYLNYILDILYYLSKFIVIIVPIYCIFKIFNNRTNVTEDNFNNVVVVANNIYSNQITTNKRLLKLEDKVFDKEYGKLEVKYTTKEHDRYIIIDQTKLYHLGYSIKDLGKKICSISESDSLLIKELINNIEQIN